MASPGPSGLPQQADAPRVLAVFADPPWRGGSGSHARDMEHLQTLATLDLDLTVLCFADSPPPPAPPWLADRATLLPILPRPAQPPLGLAAALNRGVRYLVGDTWLSRQDPPRFAYPGTYRYDQVGAFESICDAADSCRATAVVVRSWFLPYARALKRRGFVVIVDAHDSMTRAASELFWTLPRFHRWLSVPMVVATRRAERRYLRYCDEVWAPSEHDAAAIRRVSDRTRCFVYPNLVACPTLPPNGPNGTAQAEGPQEVLFVGNMHFPPNAQAAEFLTYEVLPALRARCPRATIVLVGDGVPASVVRDAHREDGLVVAGRVADLLPYYQRATAVVVPVRRGTGTKVKLLEAMAHRKPVISTSKGVEGVQARDGKHLLVADSSDAFVSAVSRVLGDAGLQARLGGAARRLIERQYAEDIGPHILAQHSLLTRGHE